MDESGGLKMAFRPSMLPGRVISAGAVAQGVQDGALSVLVEQA